MKRLALALCLLHCNSSKTGIKSPPNPGSSSFFYTLTSDHTTVVADGNDHATLTVNTRDSSGKPLAGTSLRLSVTGTHNVITPSNAQTDGNGNAVFTLSSTVAETKLISAGNAALSVSFIAGAAAPSASKLTLSPSNARANGTAAVAVAVTLVDSSGNAAAGAPLTLSISGHENTPQSPISAVADATGSYNLSLTSTFAEDKNILVSFAGGTLSATATFHDAWVPAASGLYGIIGVLGVDPGTPDTIYAGGKSGIFRSTDDGATWSPFSNGMLVDDLANQVQAFAVDVTTTPHTVYAATLADIYQLRAGDSVWQQLPWTGAPVQKLAADKGVLFAAGTGYRCPGDCQLYVAARSDAAPTWNFFAQVGATADQNVLALALDTSTDADTIYFSTDVPGQVLLSGTVKDSVTNFDATGLTNPLIQLVVATNTATPTLFAVANNGKAYTHAAGPWALAMGGLAGTVSLEQLAIDASSGDLYAAQVGTAGVTNIVELPNATGTWQLFNASPVNADVAYALALTSDKILLAGLSTGLLSFPRSSPSDATPLSNAPREMVSNEAFMVTGTDGTLYVLTLADAGADWQLFVSPDNGSTWTNPATLAAGTSANALVGGDTIYVATYDTQPHVLALTDSAWNDITGDLAGTSIYDLEALTVGGQTALYAATNAGLQMLTSGGSWSSLNATTTGLPAAVYTVGVAGGGLVADAGGFYSLSGTVWSPLAGAQCAGAGGSHSASDAQNGLAFFWGPLQHLWSVDADGNCTQLAPSAYALVDISATQLAFIDGNENVTLIDPTSGSQQTASNGISDAHNLFWLAYSAATGELFAGSEYKIYRSDSLGL